MKIMLDAGHGKTDPGAIHNGVKEADINNAIVDGVIAELSQYDVDIHKAPRDSLQARTDAANAQQVDWYISIHVNAGGGTGFESFVFDGAVSQQTEQRGAILHDAVVEHFRKYKLPDRGKKRKNFHVLRETTMPAVLLECGFIDGPEQKLLQDPIFLDQLAGSITKGIVAALSLKPNKVDYKKMYEEQKKENDQMKSVLKKIAGASAPYMIK